MSGYLKISALAFFMLIASAAATGVMKDQEMEAKIIKGIKAMKEAEKALDVKSELLELMELIKREKCSPEGHICSPDAPEDCCSGSCVAHPYLRIFVCGSEKCLPSGMACSPEAPQYCCSGSCAPHPILKIFACAAN